MATYDNIKKIKIGDNIFNLYDSGNSGGTITSVKTTAGAHTTINVTSGAANFNVPTKTSHLTNDSGFITSYTDTKNTAGSTDTSSKIYLIGATSQAANPQTYSNSKLYFNKGISSDSGIDTSNRETFIEQSPDSLFLRSLRTTNSSQLRLGFDTNNDNLVPTFYLQGESNTVDLTTYISLTPGELTITGLKTPTNNTDAATKQYVDNSIPTVPSITLNGSSSTSPSFYAPTTAGTSGYYLKSGGSNTAPSWASFPTIPSITLNGSGTTSPSFYAPTSAGTSGYYLKSSGSGAPTWTSFPTIPTITDTYSSTSSNGMSGKAVASALGSYLPLSGGTMTGNIIMNGIAILGKSSINDNANYALIGLNKTDSLIYVGSSAGTTAGIKVGLYGSNVTLSQTGNLTIEGNLTIKGHSSVIGTVLTASDTVSNLASSTDIAKQTSAKLALTAGTWAITGTVRYTSNATGRRSINLYSGSDAYEASFVTTPAASGTTTKVQSTLVTAQASDFTVYIGMQQNSGSALNGQWYIRAARIA